MYIIETHQLTKTYGSKHALNAVDLHVRQGEIYGCVGPNGAGKSTLMKLLVGLSPADDGEIFLFGEKIHPGDPKTLARIGSIIEQPTFYERLSARDNLDLHCEYMGYPNKARIAEVLDLCGLADAAEKRVSQFSMGMKQRLAIARAMLAKPALLILDEPINALDPDGIREMRALFRHLATDYGTTLFISSHILAELEQTCDTIGILQDGCLLEEVALADIHKRRSGYIETNVDNPARAAHLLAHNLDIGQFSLRQNGTLEIYDDTCAVRDIVRCFTEAGLAIDGIWRREATLEDYFFQRTGKKGGDAQ